MSNGACGWEAWSSEFARNDQARHDQDRREPDRHDVFRKAHPGNPRPRQVVRQRARPARHLAHRDAVAGGRHHRPLGIGQEHAAALLQLPGGPAGRFDHHLRQEYRHRRQDAARQGTQRPAHAGRHGVPVVQPVPASLRARQCRGRAAKAARHGQGGIRGSGAPPACQGRAGEPRRCLSRPAFRRPEAACRHCPRARHGAARDALRRADLGARSRTCRRGCCR